MGCSVESLHLTICLGMIGAGNVVPDVCELIELVSNLRIQQKKKNQREQIFSVVHKNNLCCTLELKYIYLNGV